jgi:GNAT superfamily N-acetyltransferase
MITIEKVDTRSKDQVRRFIGLPVRLYAGDNRWVQPLRKDVEGTLRRDRHPFYEDSDADFFLALRDGRDVARLGILENRPFNEYHGLHDADFCYFDCENDLEAVEALFAEVTAWAKSRGLNRVVGPKGFNALDGYGVLIEGFEYRQLMTMMAYNCPYYSQLLEKIHFQKLVDFVSCWLESDSFRMPERINRVAERIRQHKSVQFESLRSKKELVSWAQRLGKAYNRTFVQNWEFRPLKPAEIDLLVRNLLILADPSLIKLLRKQDEVIGFLLGFPDVSAALQRAKGRLLPWRILDILWEARRTEWLVLNGAGILPEYQGAGLNALLYSEIERTVRSSRFKYAHITQIAETAVQMRRDLEGLGAHPFKNHRVYAREC